MKGRRELKPRMPAKYQPKTYGMTFSVPAKSAKRAVAMIQRRIARACELMGAWLEYEGLLDDPGFDKSFKVYLRKTGRGRLVRYIDGWLAGTKRED